MNNSTQSKIADTKTISVNDCLRLLTDYEDKIVHFSGNQSDFIQVMESLWSFFVSVEDTEIVLSLMDNEQVASTRQFLSRKWHEYISLIETNIANKFLQSDTSRYHTSALSEEDYAGVEKELISPGYTEPVAKSD